MSESIASQSSLDRKNFDHLENDKFVPADKSWAEDYWKHTPIRVRDEYCHCNEMPYGTPNLVGYHTLFTNEEYLANRKFLIDNYKSIKERGLRGTPSGSYCVDCLLPSKYTLAYVYRFCEGCGLSYVPKPSRETYPLKHILCPKCDVPTPRRTTKRTGFTFS